MAAYSRIGGRAPASCVASGKALLAAARLDRAALEARLGTLERHTPHSIVDFDALAAELERTQARGYAENREEWRLGVCGLGAPIFNARGEPVLAVGMSVPSIRFAARAGEGLCREAARLRPRRQRRARLPQRRQQTTSCPEQ